MSAAERKRLDLSHLTSFRTSTETKLLAQQQQLSSKKKLTPQCNAPSITYYSPYRLLVAPHANIDVQALSNCDKEVPWNTVEYVVRANSLDDNYNCPICLGSFDDSTLLFPKISKCGHIFCLFCVTKYLSTGIGAQPCPICNINIVKNELKTVHMLFKYVTDNKIQLKNNIKLNLLSIYENTLFPFEGYEHKIEKPRTGSIVDIIPGNETSRALFSRINIISSAKLKENIQNEYAEILKFYQQVLHEGDTDGILHYFDPILTHLSSKLTMTSTPVATLSNAKVIDYVNEKRTKLKYFYQAESGELVFLHSLCFKMLSKQYSITDYANVTGIDNALIARHNMPQEILGNIIGIDTIKLTTDIKKKNGGIFNHIPTNVEIQIVELDMRPLVCEEIIAEYLPELKERKRQRLKKKQSVKQLELDDEYQRAINESLIMYNSSLQNSQLMELLNSPKLGRDAAALDNVAPTLAQDSTTKAATSGNIKSFASITKDNNQYVDFPTLGDLLLPAQQKPKTVNRSKKTVFRRVNTADLMFK